MPNENNTRTYTATIVESNRELSVQEKVKMKDTRDAISLEKISREQSVILGVTGYAVLAIHNEKSEDKDYYQYLLLGANGDFASLNLFAYCGNNPVNNYDPSGNFFISGTIGVFTGIGIVLTGIIAILTVNQTAQIVKNEVEYKLNDIEI